MSLLRRVIGGVLRRLRLRQGRTLREVAEAAGVSVPYLSEVERGRKEASSEVLAAICRALGIHLSDLLEEARDDLRRVEPRIPAAPRAGLARLERAEVGRPDAVTPAVRVAPRAGGPLLHLAPRPGGTTLRVGRPASAVGGRSGPRTRVALGCGRTRAGARTLTVV
ncbi:helix-turn-helix transcriptional regulator [Micromonospora sp. DSM 115977]|uniref:Helix-turn-helix transcriptional regulator n=1 Tax=Micromonospora reichwaldensis TaxID=3075516 RepID=A0ABU2WQX9_9ACTN|nr:helix-turn-helix transcriptional regulator [Micromonospora sp. DSM 115977]MDT0528315.1 helix-turn-helix transcriptional regulator [Micromonospora sp. DSM 115977]